LEPSEKRILSLLILLLGLTLLALGIQYNQTERLLEAIKQMLDSALAGLP